MAARAVDEHRALDFGGDADQRPFAHFALGDEGDRRLSEPITTISTQDTWLEM